MATNSTSGHESEAINVEGLKAALKASGNKGLYNYATCSTAAGTPAKVIDTAPTSFSLETGAVIVVKFTNAITVANATLKVGSSGTAKSIYYRGAALAANKVAAGAQVMLRYNGTQYDIIGDLDTNTGAVTSVVGQTGAVTSTQIATALTNDGKKLTDTTYKFTIGSTTKGDTTNGTDLGTLKSESAASGGTTLSLVTTGEKYTWNNKANSATTLSGYGITNAYTKNETYTKEEVNSLVSTPYQNYFSVTATSSTTNVASLLPATGSVGTIYRVGHWDGSRYVTSLYSEYAWNGSSYIKLDSKGEKNVVATSIPFSDFTTVTGFFISGSNGRFGAGTHSAYMYIAVKPGEVYSVLAGPPKSIADGSYAFLRSITQNPQDYQESDNVGYGFCRWNQITELTIPTGCNFLAISLQNSNYNMRPDYIERVYKYNKVYLIPVYGQSLALGSEASLITSFCRFPENCGNTTSLDLSFSGQESSSFGLIESFCDNFSKEERKSVEDIDFKVVSFASGTGSTSITGLKKGTTNYSNLIAQITAAKNNGYKVIVPAFCWVQGEEDRNDAVNDYKGELAQLRIDLDADIKSITGQTQDVHCIVYQTNQLSLLNLLNPGYFAPNNYKSGANGGACITVPQAQYELIRDNQYFHASTPIYPLSFVVSPNNQMIHIDSQSQKLMGYYEGLAAKRLVDGHGYNIGLIATNVTKIDSTHIKLTLSTPCPPVVIDTKFVKEVANYGFSVIKSNNTNIISNVQIDNNHFSGTDIIITTSSDCTGAKLRYGINGTDGKSGFSQGSRGNIRDSQGDSYTAYINGKRVRLDNWLYFFEYLIG